MTNSEAIEVLKKNYPDSCYSLLREAVDTAIYALTIIELEDSCTKSIIELEDGCTGCKWEHDNFAEECNMCSRIRVDNYEKEEVDAPRN